MDPVTIMQRERSTRRTGWLDAEKGAAAVTD
jgi:hypothetical protein